MAKTRTTKGAKTAEAKKRGAAKKGGAAKAAPRAKPEAKALADARRALDGVRAHWAEIEAVDATRTRKLMPKARLEAFEAAVRRAAEAFEEAAPAKAAPAPADGAREEKVRIGRAVLLVSLDRIRADVAERASADAGLQRAFAVGRRVSAKSTGEVVALAEEHERAFADADVARRARAAGVTRTRIDAVAAQRRALEALSAAPPKEAAAPRAPKRAAPAEKRRILLELAAAAAHAEKALAAVVRG